MPVIPGVRRLMQEDQEFVASLSYVGRSVFKRKRKDRKEKRKERKENNSNKNNNKVLQENTESFPYDLGIWKDFLNDIKSINHNRKYQ
jgi:hypothetical protein